MSITHPLLNRRQFLQATVQASAALVAAGRGVFAAETLRAGAAAMKITPKLGVSLDGYIMKLGPCTAVHDDLHARCIVIDDGSIQLALVINDLTCVPREFFDRAKAKAQRATGIPEAHMLMAATHSHSAPRVGVAKEPLDLEYEEFFVDQMAAAIIQAHENLASARIGFGSVQMPDFVFNRRWYMKPGSIPPDPFGGTTDRVRFNPPVGSADLVKPAGLVDPEVSLLSIEHADGRPLALLANYGMHYAGGFKPGEISADYFGVFARKVEDTLGQANGRPSFVAAMSNGTSGNVGGGHDFTVARPAQAPYEHMEEVGVRIAAAVLDARKQIEHRAAATLDVGTEEIEVGVRKPDGDRLAWARAVLANPEAKTPHRWSSIYAKEALLLDQYPPTVHVLLQAFRIGDAGIAASPCETFAETGLAIKAASPLKPTFTIELANQYLGYLPTREQHALGGYETWPVRSSLLEVGAEEKIRSGLLGLLESLARRA